MLEGVVAGRTKNALLLKVGGIGYRVFTTGATREASKDGSSLSLHTHLAVREDDLSLYGFPAQEELDLFELLISISGIGPRSALGVLELADVSTIA